MKKILLIALIFIFFVYLFFVWMPIPKLVTYFLVDDAFYYFKTASHISLGNGPTFDGEHMTNGYHPLWMGLLSVIYFFSPDSITLPLHIVLTLSVVLFFLTSIMLWKIIFSLTGSHMLSGVLTFLYAINPWNVGFFISGLETPLALFLFVLCFFCTLKVIEESDVIKNYFFLGCVSSLLILSRLDYGIFVAVLFVFLCFVVKKNLFKKLLFFTLPVVMIATPWFLYNYFYFGSFLPTSGLSYTLINHRLFFYKERTIVEIILWSTYNLFSTVASILKTIGIPIYFSAKDLMKTALSGGSVFALILLTCLFLYKRKKEKFLFSFHQIFCSHGVKVIIPFFIGFSLLVFIHGAIRWSGRIWYFATFQILCVVFLSLVLHSIPARPYLKKIGFTAVILIALFYFASFKTLFPQYSNQREMYEVAIWIKNNLPPNSRIASFNSGIHGYFSNHFVMNSDGLINNDAYEAMKKNTLWDFFKKEKINYIVDYETVLTYRYKSFFGISEPIDKVTKVQILDIFKDGSNYGGTHIGIYKL